VDSREWRERGSRRISTVKAVAGKRLMKTMQAGKYLVCVSDFEVWRSTMAV
jgi:hypothetical protein